MTTLSVRLPESLHDSAKDLAKKEHISLNQLVTLAVAEKLSVLTTEDYLQERAKRGKRKKFLKALSKAPNKNPDKQDVL